MSKCATSITWNTCYLWLLADLSTNLQCLLSEHVDKQFVCGAPDRRPPLAATTHNPPLTSAQMSVAPSLMPHVGGGRLYWSMMLLRTKGGVVGWWGNMISGLGHTDTQLVVVADQDIWQRGEVWGIGWQMGCTSAEAVNKNMERRGWVGVGVGGRVWR